MMMNDRLMRGLLAAPANADQDSRVHGVVIGIVVDNQDPDALHRVKLRFPWLSDDQESAWARMAVPMAGGGRGTYWLPEIGDEALVAFEHGSIEHPFVLGMLWNGQDKPPEPTTHDNDNRSITSRSGHVIRLCDKSGGESIEIVDHTGGNRVVIHSVDNSIAIEAQGPISLKSATGMVTIEGVGVKITSQAGIELQAQTMLQAQASGPVAIKGAVVGIN